MYRSKTNWILNDDGSIYHLHLKKDELSNCIITVGDLQRVDHVAQYLDRIETKKQNREFKTITGYSGKQRISVVSTGIGMDNVDIVLNEIDYLFNWDGHSSDHGAQAETLQFIRLGTSGAIQKDIPLDSLLISETAFSLGGLPAFYPCPGILLCPDDQSIGAAFQLPVYRTKADAALVRVFKTKEHLLGNTLTCEGFYAPQGRSVRGMKSTVLKSWESFSCNAGKLHNLEMETAGIYGLSCYLGHKAVSIQAILANRITGKFSNHPLKTIDKMIQSCFDCLSSLGS